MKKPVIIMLVAVATLVPAGCSDTRAGTTAHEDPQPAAAYKAGLGLQLSPAAIEFAGIETREVSLRAFAGPADAVAVPSAAVLHTVRGSFVYVENGGWFLLTPVVTGRTDADHVEIREGLYEGDFVVTHGIRQLALAEIQALNGGVGCADGH